MFCDNCGAQISDGAKFCVGCGKSRPPISTTPRAPAQKSASSAIGIAALILGISGVILPYFAAVFLVPAALICGFIALVRGQRGMGVAGIALGILGVVGIVHTSQTISSIARDPFNASLPNSRLDPPATVTRAKYERIQDGMFYEQVVGIIGQEGQELSRSSVAGYSTVMYSWKNSNGSNMNAMFQNGRLVTKAQFGLP
jgi:hypothetical protein